MRSMSFFRRHSATLFINIVSLAYLFFSALPVFAVLSPTITLSNTASGAQTNIIMTVNITTPVPAGGALNINLPEDTVMQTGLNYTDIDFLVNGTNQVLSAYTGSNPEGTNAVSINILGTKLVQIVLDANGSGLASGASVVVKIGNNATYGAEGNEQFINGAPGTATYEVRTVAANNSVLDMGSYEVTISAAVPEFSTIMYILTAAGATWFVYQRIQVQAFV